MPFKTFTGRYGFHSYPSYGTLPDNSQYNNLANTEPIQYTKNWNDSRFDLRYVGGHRRY
jgi:hypothetical protein